MRRFLGYEEILECLVSVERLLGGLHDRMRVLEREMERRGEIEADSIAYLRRIQDQVDSGHVDFETGMLDDLSIPDFDPNLGY